MFLWKKKIKTEECKYYNVCEDMVEILKKIGVYYNEKNND